MSQSVTSWALVISVLLTRPALGADVPRFLEESESTIGVLVGDREQMAQIWIGRTEVVERTGVRRAVEAAAIQMPRSKLFWWMLSPSQRPTPQALQEFKKNVRCVAEPAAIICFGASSWNVFSRKVSENLEGTEIGVLVGKRIAQLDADSFVRALYKSWESIPLDDVQGIAPLYARSGEEIGGPVPLFEIATIVPHLDGWELTIRNSISGRISAVRLDRALSPISGTMIK